VPYPAWKKERSLLELRAFNDLLTFFLVYSKRNFRNIFRYVVGLVTFLCSPSYPIYLCWLVQAGHTQPCATGEQGGRGLSTGKRSSSSPSKIPLLLSVSQGTEKALNVIILKPVLHLCAAVQCLWFVLGWVENSAPF